MPLSFVHTADWHIGKPFGRLPAEQAAKLRGARLDAIDKIAEVARGGNAATILVGGDLFDRPNLSDRDLRVPLAQLAAHADLSWHIIPGNHDPASNGGVWERALRDGLPANVRLHSQTRPIPIADDAWLLPSPLATRSVASDPTGWMDAAATPSNAIRIGLAHGSVQGFGSENTASISIAADRPQRAGLDYLALGDWHGTQQIGHRCWYSGTPEPDSFRDNGQGHVLLVTIEGRGAMPIVHRREVGTYRWLGRKIDASRRTDLSALEGEIEGLGAQARHVLLSLSVEGQVTFEQDREIRSKLQKLDERVFHLESRLDAMIFELAEADLRRLGGIELQELGRELAAVANEADHPEQQVAARALRHLVDMCARLGADAGRTA